MNKIICVYAKTHRCPAPDCEHAEPHEDTKDDPCTKKGYCDRTKEGKEQFQSVFCIKHYQD